MEMAPLYEYRRVAKDSAEEVLSSLVLVPGFDHFHAQSELVGYTLDYEISNLLDGVWLVIESRGCRHDGRSTLCKFVEYP